MILLDTDHLSVLKYTASSRCQALIARMQASPDQQIGTTIVSVEEQWRGWFAVIARRKDVHRQDISERVLRAASSAMTATSQNGIRRRGTGDAIFGLPHDFSSALTGLIARMPGARGGGPVRHGACGVAVQCNPFRSIVVVDPSAANGAHLAHVRRSPLGARTPWQ
jgi:hypothetical protein